jgi:hypothetical protein
MFEGIDIVLNTESVPSNISYKTDPTVIIETLLV